MAGSSSDEAGTGAPAPDGATLGSFRDPSGHVLVRDGVLYRHVGPSYRSSYEQLMASGLYRRLTEDRLLVPHDEIDRPEAISPGAFRVIRPRPIRFVSYPYEWSPSQLRQAALLTLGIERLALEHGMSLKDASAYNVQFDGVDPVLIDTLSFEPARPTEPWVPYRQFCQHFLAPLALMCRRDVRLGRLLATHIDGVPLDLACRLLPRRAWLRPGLFMHLLLHARSQRLFGQRPVKRRSAGRMGRLGRLGLIDSLEAAIRSLAWKPPRSTWSGYSAAPPYDPGSLTRKDELVAAMLDRVGPGTVWDLGANDGRFSRIAAAAGAYTVAFDDDAVVVERNVLAARAKGRRDLLPLWLDLTNPSPGLGWRHRERLSLIERGPADAVLALALVHHLAFANNLPLAEIAAFLAATGRTVIVEYVPREDPQALRLMAGREPIFAGYTREAFERELGLRFRQVEEEPVGTSGRALYLYERR